MNETTERTMDATLRLGPAAPSPPPTLPPALRLGRYAVVRHIGSGGMGSVYVAYDEELHRRVAIKLLLDASGDAHARARMVQEARALAQLSHPNVVQIHDIGEAAGRIFLAMEYIEGETLREWKAAARPTIDAIREVYLQAGRGLAAAHAAGLVHRDFKADNAMIGADGRVRVVDFGLARVEPASAGPGIDPHAAPHLTLLGTLLGTPAYMSPEQFRREPADARSDQFSFCVALYEAFYDQRPFDGATIAELDAAVAAGAVQRPPAGVEVPPRLHRALLRGLAREPEQRWPTMDALLRELAVDHQRDPSAAPRLRRRLIGAWLAVFLLIQGTVLVRLSLTGQASTPEHHWIEGIFVWTLFVVARVSLRDALREHALHRSIFDTFLISATGMTLSRWILYVSGASLPTIVASDLILVATAMGVGAALVARWMLLPTIVGAALAAWIALRRERAADEMLVVYSLLNISIFIGWVFSSRPAAAAAADRPALDPSPRRGSARR